MDKLMQEIHAGGCEARFVSICRLADLKNDIESRHEQGLFDTGFYQERLTRFEFQPPSEMPDARSILVLAKPTPQTGVVFHWNGESKTVILPPTYAGYTALPLQIESWLNEFLNPLGYRALKAMRLPLKPLAVRSGLADYGRNNITYVAGMGSFHHLIAFFTDSPVECDEWREPQMLERCKNCRACIIKCPSGAIGGDRFLLYAERCLVFHNEKPADVPFAAWIDPSWHNALFGCMICQRFCPEDKKVSDWIETLAEFSDEETYLLLSGSSPDVLPAATIQKLDLLELTDSLDVLPRNLGTLLNQKVPGRVAGSGSVRKEKQ